MSDVRTLGSVNLNDRSKYYIPVRTESERKVFEEVWDPIRNNSLINLGNFDHTATILSWEVWVTGTSWANVLTNYAAIQTALNSAAAFSIFGTGSAITYVEQAADQSSPTTYTVKRGTFLEDRPRRLVEKLRMVGKLELLCNPL